jgi:hypothetical protein
MATNEMPFRPINWAGQDPHGVTTGWHQADAGAGRHVPERIRRGRGVQSGPTLFQLPNIVSPLAVNEVQAFAQEAAPPRRNVLLDATVGGVLGYALVRSIERRRGQR